MQDFSLSPMSLFASFLNNRHLTKSLVKREIIGRYRGSMLGLLWSFFNPVLMLLVYTFVFSVIFQARWGGGGDSKTEFALVLFAGLIVFSLFSEMLNRSPRLILDNVNYVKKVVFPLEILPIVALGAALFHMLISLMVWAIAFALLFGRPPITACLLPIVLMPLILFTLGISWLLASLGVYLRDLSQFVAVISTVLMFLSPIFYPVSALPEEYQYFLYLNPLTNIIEQVRNVLYWGNLPDFFEILISTLLSLLFAWFGFAWFQKTRKGFSDVL